MCYIASEWARTDWRYALVSTSALSLEVPEGGVVGTLMHLRYTHLQTTRHDFTRIRRRITMAPQFRVEHPSASIRSVCLVQDEDVGSYDPHPDDSSTWEKIIDPAPHLRREVIVKEMFRRAIFNGSFRVSGVH